MAKPRTASEHQRRAPVYEPIVPPPSESFVWRCDDYPLPWTVWNNHPECEIHFIRNASGTCYVSVTNSRMMGLPKLFYFY
jgi:hypothetical protein